METSAKEATNVQFAFERVLNEIYKIATKNAVKEIKPSSPTVIKGKKVSEEVEPEPKVTASHKLDAGKLKKKEGSKKCC